MVESLENRTLLSVSPTAAFVSSATFHDAMGDLVTIRITGHNSITNTAGRHTKPATFQVNLDGGAVDNADVESIVIDGWQDAQLSVVVTPVHYWSLVGVPTLSAGVMDIQKVSVTDGTIAGKGTTTLLRGIAASGASLDDVELGGVTIQSLSINPGKAPQVDIVNSHLSGQTGFNQAYAGQVDFGIINAANIGTLSITGLRSTNTNGNGGGANGNNSGGNPIDGNDFVGPITVTGNIGSIVGSNATLTSNAPVTVGGTIGTINIFGNHTSVTASSIGKLQGQDLANMAVVTSDATGTLTLNNQSTSFFSVDVAGNVNFGSSVPFNGSITAGGIVSGLAASTTDAIMINTGTLTSQGIIQAGTSGTLAAGTNAITNITFTGAGGFAGVLQADSGSIGLIKANQLGTGDPDGDNDLLHADADDVIGVTINAQQGAIAGITTNTAIPGVASIANAKIHAGTTIGAISARASASGTVAIDDSSFRADGGFTGAITVVGPIGIRNSAFSTAGDFGGAITVTSTQGVTGPAITSTATSTNGFSTGFSAGGTFASGFTINGSVSGTAGPVLFLAGFDIGADNVLGTGDDAVGSATAATQTLNALTISGAANNAVFAAGVNPSDGTFGDGDDVLNNANATLVAPANVVTIGGAVTNSVFESGSVFPAGLTGSQVFNNNWVEAFTGNIGDIVRTGSFAGDAFGGNHVIADVGSIGNILILNNSGGSPANAIHNDVILAGGSIGDVVGITKGFGTGILDTTIKSGLVDVTAGTGTIEGIASASAISAALNGGDPSGIDGLTARAGTAGIGNAISAAATTFITNSGATLPAAAPIGTTGVIGVTNLPDVGEPANGIASSTIVTTGAIANVIGVSTNANGDEGIIATLVRARGTIGSVNGVTANNGAAGISGSAFDAGQNIGAVAATGNISNSKFIAGIDLGADFTIAGGLFTGFGGTGLNVDTAGSAPASIGSVTLTTINPNTPAMIDNSDFLAGVTGTGPDLAFGGFDDATLTGSFIGDITAPGGIDSSYFQSGAIGNTTVTNGAISNTTYKATQATGAGIGNVTVVLGTAGVGVGASVNAIESTDLFSAASVGNVSGTIRGINLSSSDRGLYHLTIAADGAVGNVTGSDQVTGTSSNFRNGMSNVVIEGAKSVGGVNSAAASVGNILGEVTGTDDAFSHGIVTTNVLAGSIGNVTGNNASAGQSTNDGGITLSTFRATTGNIGNITASTAGTIALSGLLNVAFNAFGSIGAINAIGNITNAVFIAGVDLGANFSNTGAGGAPSAAMGFDLATVTGVNADVQNTAPTSIGNITLAAVTGGGTGKITSSTFSAGLTSLGADNAFGGTLLNADTNVAGATVGNIVAPGGIDPTFVTSGAIGTTLVTNGAISNTTYQAVDAAGAGIGDITVTDPILTASTAKRAIVTSTFNSAAAIGNVSATVSGTSTAGSDAGISGTTFTAGTSIGNVTAVDSVTGGSNLFRDGMVDVTLTAGTTVGNISGTVTDTVSSSDSVAVQRLAVTAGGDVGNVTGTVAGNVFNNFDGGIFASTVRSGGSIGDITAGTAGTTGFDAIRGSAFNAFGDIGNVTATGDISGSVFIAGVDLGSNLSTVGAGGAPAITMGFTRNAALLADTGTAADVPNAAAVSIGNITLTAVAGGATGKLNSTTFSAGLTALGADDAFGGAAANADTVVAGSSVGNISAPGGIDPVFVTSGGSIGTTTVAAGAMDTVTYNAGSSIGDITVTNSAGDAITGVSLTAGTSIGNVSGTASGDGTGGTVIGTGITGTTLTAGTSIGNVTGTGGDIGLELTSNWAAGTSIGTVSGVSTGLSGGANDALDGGLNSITAGTSVAGVSGVASTINGGSGITSLTVNAGTSIGPVTGTTAGTGVGSQGIVDSNFIAAGGDLGAIVASTASASPAIGVDFNVQNLFVASGNVGTITVTGDVSDSKFLAGYNITAGTGPGFDAGDTINNNATIGNVTVSGAFVASDLAASVLPAVVGAFGAAGDVGAGNSTGTIGNVTIGSATAFVNPVAFGAGHAIEAGTLGTITVAANPPFAPTFLNTPVAIDNGGGGVGASDVIIDIL